MCIVSVIIPYFNRAQTLVRALDSVRYQTFKEWEIILVNDGSTDQSELVVVEYISNYPELNIKHIIQKNTGPAEARNNGIRNAIGKYIAFLDSDDSWEPEKLDKQIAYMERYPEVIISGTNYSQVNNGKSHRYPLNPKILKADFYRMLFKVVFITPTVVVRREVFFRDNLWFKPGKNQGEDLLLYLQIIRQHQGVRLSEPLANLFKLEYGEEGSLTGDLGKLLHHELDNLKIIYFERTANHRVSCPLYLILVLYTYLKHFKRLFRSTWHKSKFISRRNNRALH